MLREIYGSYIDAARSCGLPVVIGTPTFRASLDFVRMAELGGEEAVRSLNRDAAMMLREIRAGSNYRPVHIAGVIGPSGDAYRPEEALSAGQARGYHGLQADALSRSGKANASPLSPEELIQLDHPEGDEPERFADEMWQIHRDFGLHILGGCCGTDDRHIRALALRMAAS